MPPKGNRKEMRIGAWCLRRLFDTQGGAWHNVCVDDYVPVTAKDRTPCFARPTNNQNELWVPLLEKALAKVLTAPSEALATQAAVRTTCASSEPAPSRFLRSSSGATASWTGACRWWRWRA